MRVLRKRPVPQEPKKFTPNFKNPGKPVEMLIRFSPYGGGVAKWYELSAEVQKLLGDHFGGRFIDADGTTIHVGLIIKDTGTQ